MASADLRKELQCSVCLSIYTNPVTLKCGHNFCRDCIDRVLDTQEGSGGYSCPECREEFQERPALRRNIALRNIAENFLPAQTDQKESGIFCTYCIHIPVPAVKSCLLCDASMCDNHLRVHSKSPEHVLCDPTTSLESRKCSVHKKILAYYCTEDSACICVSCRLDGEHRGHRVETLHEASEMRKEKLIDVLQKLRTEREETEKRVQSLQERRRKVQGEAAEETERVTALIRDLRRRLEDLEKRVLSDISGQAERVSLSLDDLIQQLEIKKDELSKKMEDIEELCNMTDPLTVLQQSDTGDLCDTEDGDDEGRERHDRLLHDGADLDVAAISHTLHTGLCDIMSGVNVQERPGTHVYPHSSAKGKVSQPHIRHTSHRQARGPNIGAVQERSEVSGQNVQERPGTHVHPHSSTKGKVHINAEPSRLHHRHSPTVPRSPDQAAGQNIGAVQQTLGVSRVTLVVMGVTLGVLGVTLGMFGVTDVLLDVSTAGNHLHISDDGKTASFSSSHQNRPETPERFRYYQVLSSRSFSSGRHYWEVDVGGSSSWMVGACYPSIERNGGPSVIGHNKKSWCLQRWDTEYSVIHDSDKIRLSRSVSSNRVRIFVDYEAGKISFYDVCDPIRHLHTFTTTFTEPLHVGLLVRDGWIKISEGNLPEDW